MRALIATVAAVLLTACVAAASGTSSRLVIAYVSSPTLLGAQIYVIGPGGTRELGTGADPSVAPDGLLVSGSVVESGRPALTVYATSAKRSHSFFNRRVVARPMGWSPDSRYLAVLLQTAGTRQIPTGLAVIDTTTMTARTVATGAIRGASFAPSGPDRLVYGRAISRQPRSAVNLYTVNPDGSDRTQLTAGGYDLRPLWTARGIVYDHVTPASAGAAPASQLWLLHAGHSTQLTHLATPARGAALWPVAASANGNRLIAQYVTPGDLVPIAVQVSPRRVRPVATGANRTLGAGISPDGRTVLVDRTGFPSERGVIETLPFGGGRPTPIARGDQAAWNG